MKPKIAVVGSSNTDMIIKLARIPRPGETILGGEFITAAGGKGANQAVGAARAGGDVTFVARIGNDVFGNEALKGFKTAGIRVTNVIRDLKHPSGVALIFVGADGQNSIAVASGANACLSPADLQQAATSITSAKVLLLQLETPLPTVERVARIASRAGVKVILNPAPAQPLPDSLLKMISVLTPNESEAELLTGIAVTNEKRAGDAAKKLMARGVATVIITLGARGAFVASASDNYMVPGFKAKAVDTTAAGDIFNGALAVALAERSPIREAVLFANAAAAISVTRMGAQPSAPAREEINRVLRKGRL